MGSKIITMSVPIFIPSHNIGLANNRLLGPSSILVLQVTLDNLTSYPTLPQGS